MQFIAVMPHDEVPNKQLALWTMHVSWEPRCFFRLLPGATYDDVLRQFICHAQHWSDKLFLLENIEYTSHEINSLMRAPLAMQARNAGMQLLAFKDRPTMVMRRDLLDAMEGAGLSTNWFEQRIDIPAIAERIGCNVGLYDPSAATEEASQKLDIEEAAIDGIQESTLGRDRDHSSERPILT